MINAVNSRLTSGIFRDWFSSAEMREVFSDSNTIQQWMEVEAALAEAQAELGIIPAAAAAGIRANAVSSLIPFEILRDGYQVVGYPILPLLQAWEAHLDSAARWVHFGATTQDITDTGLVLQLRAAIGILEAGLDDLLRSLAGLADRHRGTIMAGRTHGQHAVPLTFGFKAAGWLAELIRHRERLQALKPRLLVIQLGGAAGTLASLGQAGPSIQSLLSRRLGLSVPAIAWHSSRDALAEFANWLAMFGATLEKVAHEIELLQKTEVAELAEAHEPSKGASSTMPQKRNPATCEAIIALGKMLRQQVPAMLCAMTPEHERDWWAQHVEWKTLPEMCLMCSGALELSRRVVLGLQVDGDNMRRNLDCSRGLIMAEAVMLRLAPSLGRNHAHHLVYRASMRALEQNIPLGRVLQEDPEFAEQVSMADQAELEKSLDPRNYLGQADQWIDRVLEQV